MDVLFEASFAKDLKRIRDKQMLQRIQQTIAQVKQTDNLIEVHNLKKMQGYSTFYRVRLGDFRIGIEVLGSKVIFVRVLHRKDIYRKFP